MGETIYADEPLSGDDSALDSVGHAVFATRVAGVLHSLRSESTSSVVSLVGPWGAGKTSTLNLTAALLADEAKPWVTAFFNPWLFPDADSLLAGFLKTVQEAMPGDSEKGSQIRRRIGDFAETISPVGKVTGLFGLDSSGLIEMVGKQLAKGPSSDQAQRALAKELEKLKTPLLIAAIDGGLAARACLDPSDQPPARPLVGAVSTARGRGSFGA